MLKKKKEVNVTAEKKNVAARLFGSFLVAAALFGVLIGVEKNMLNDYAKETVVLCKADVQKGTKITEANVGQYFYTYEVDAELVDEKCVRDKNDLLDTVVGRTLTAHEIVRKDGWEKEAEIYANLNDPAEASFVANDAGDIVSGSIRRGDHVDIAIVNKDTLEYEVMLKDVYVVDAFTNTGEKVTSDMEGTAATMLTIVEEKENLARFYSAMETGTVIVTKLDTEH